MLIIAYTGCMVTLLIIILSMKRFIAFLLDILKGETVDKSRGIYIKAEGEVFSAHALFSEFVLRATSMSTYIILKIEYFCT